MNKQKKLLINWIATYYLREEFEIALLNLGVEKDA